MKPLDRLPKVLYAAVNLFMPIISTFFGIVIRMFYREHEPPHFHADYQGQQGKFNFDGKMRLVLKPLVASSSSGHLSIGTSLKGIGRK